MKSTATWTQLKNDEVLQVAGPFRNSTGQPPSITGTVQSDAVRGRPRLRAWPPKKAAAAKAKNQEQIEWFRQAQFLAKYAASTQMKVAREVTTGTPLMPRDLLTMAMAGRLWVIKDQNGKEIWPVAVRNDVSQALDLLSKKAGSILYRGPDIWEGSNPPSGTLNALFANSEGAVEWRAISSLSESYKTRLIRSTGQSANGQMILAWDTVIFDDAALWNPAEPTKITAPQNGLLKITWNFFLTEQQPAGGSLAIYDETITTAYGYKTLGVTFGDQVTADWFPVSAGDSFVCRLFTSANRTIDPAITWCLAEFLPTP